MITNAPSALPRTVLVDVVHSRRPRPGIERVKGSRRAA
jgi:hypothetical protein